MVKHNPAFTPSGNDTLLNEIAEYFEEAISKDDNQFVDVVEGRTHFQAILSLVCNRVNAHAASLVFLDPSLAFENIFAHGALPDFVHEWWNRVGTNKGLVGRAVRENKTLWTPDVSQEPDYEKIAKEDTISQLTLLLKDHGTPQAVLAIEWSYLPGDEISIVPYRHDFATRLAMQIFSFRARVFALRSQRAFDAAQQVAQRETTDERIKGLLDAVHQLTGGGEVAVLRRIGSKLQVTQKVELTVDPPPIDILVQANNGYVAEVAFTRKAFYCDDTEDETRFPFYRPVEQLTRTQFSVPLLFRRELVGVLNVGSKFPYAFNYMTRGLLTQFAAHAAAILYNTTVLDGIRGIYKHVRTYLSYLVIIAPSVEASKESDPDSPTFLGRVERIRESVEDVWIGLAPPQKRSDSSSTIVAEALRDTITNELYALLPDTMEVTPDIQPLQERLISCDIESTKSVCASAIRSAVRSISPSPTSLQLTIGVRQREYDRSARHSRLSVGTEAARVSYLVVTVEFRVPAPCLQAIPSRHLVDPSIASEGDPLVPVRDLGVNLWACDRVLSIAGGFVGAQKVTSDRLVLSFWLLEEERSE